MKLWIASGMVLAALVTGCGGGGGDDSPAPAALPAPADSSGGIEVVASNASDQRIGDGLAAYLNRNCPDKVAKSDNPTMQQLYKSTFDFCESVERIEVDDKRITLHSNLDSTAGPAVMGDVFCMFVMGSDVADFTQGHTLLDANGKKIETCQAPSGS